MSLPEELRGPRQGPPRSAGGRIGSWLEWHAQVLVSSVGRLARAPFATTHPRGDRPRPRPARLPAPRRGQCAGGDSAHKAGTRRIFFNRFNSAGAKASAADIQVSDAATSAMADCPRLAVRQSGFVAGKANIFVAWENLGNDNDLDIYADRSVSGSAWAGDIQVNDDADPAQPHAQEPALAADAAGNVAVAWSDRRKADADIYCAFSIDTGATFKTNILLNSDAVACEQSQPAVAMTRNGLHVGFAWTDSRNGTHDAYFCRNSFLDESRLCSALIQNASGGSVGVSDATTLHLKKCLQAGKLAAVGSHAPPEANLEVSRIRGDIII